MYEYNPQINDTGYATDSSVNIGSPFVIFFFTHTNIGLADTLISV